MQKDKTMQDGLYLIADPAMEPEVLLNRLSAALSQPLAAIQIWNNFKPGADAGPLIEAILEQTGKRSVPVLINNQWELLLSHELQGVHFDVLPENLSHIRSRIGRSFITGVTCSNDPEVVRAAARAGADYISFCSLFPSPTANSCELVDFASVERARAVFPGKIYLSGGIVPDNMASLASLPYDGIAVVSGVMSQADPAGVIRQYAQHLHLKS